MEVYSVTEYSSQRILRYRVLCQPIAVEGMLPTRKSQCSGLLFVQTSVHSQLSVFCQISCLCIAYKTHPNHFLAINCVQNAFDKVYFLLLLHILDDESGYLLNDKVGGLENFFTHQLVFSSDCTNDCSNTPSFIVSICF